MQSGYGVTGGITTLSPSAPTILFKHLFFNDQKYGGVIQLFSPHIRPILPIIRSFAMTLLHQIFRQAQSSICLNSPVLLNLTLFPDHLTALRINATFQKVGIVSGTLSIVLSAAVYSRPFHRVTNNATFQKVGTVCGTAAALEFDGICGKVFLDHKSDLEDDSVIELS